MSIYLVFLRFFDHIFPLTNASLFLFFINVISYLLYSFFILRNNDWKNVWGSTLLFLVIGLFIWKIHLMTTSDILGNLFWIYHIVGYTSFIWYVESFIDPFIESYRSLGYLYSIIPSGLILAGFYLGRYAKMKDKRH